MASARRGSEIQALVFDQSRTEETGVTISFSPKFTTRYLIKSLTPGTFQRSLLASQRLSLLLPHESSSLLSQTLTEPPELRKGWRHLLVLIKDNNGGKELSAASSSRWICTTIVESHAALQYSRSFPGSVKAQEVRAMATS